MKTKVKKMNVCLINLIKIYLNMDVIKQIIKRPTLVKKKKTI
jgi:hypothetical protein